MSKPDVVNGFADPTLAAEGRDATVRDLREGLQQLMGSPDLPDDEKRLVRIAWSGVRYANAIARHGADDEIARRLRLELPSAVKSLYYPPVGRVPKKGRAQ